MKNTVSDDRAALAELLEYVDRNTCTHEDTHRGGAIWTICDGCGKKWADDEGGFVPHQDAPAVAAARAALASAPVVYERPLGAIINGRTLAERLEAYGFECEAGDLRLCNDWVEFRRCFEHLAEWASTLASAPVAGEAQPVAYCQPDDPVNSSAFSWPGLGRKKAHTTPLYAAPQPSADAVSAAPAGIAPSGYIHPDNVYRLERGETVAFRKTPYNGERQIPVYVGSAPQAIAENVRQISPQNKPDFLPPEGC